MSARVTLVVALLVCLPAPLILAGDGVGTPSPMKDPLAPVVETDCAEQVISPAHNLEVVRCEPFERALMTLGHRRDWRRIEWRTDVRTALADARRLGKPIAAVLMLNEYSQGDAGFN